VFVFTAFLDKETYEAKTREIAKKPYSVQENSAFSYCLTSDGFEKNYLRRDMSDYRNEDVDFMRLCNCDATVPVAHGSEAAQNRDLFGFLTCGVLVADASGTAEVLDESTLNLMFAVASHIGVLLNYSTNTWNSIINETSTTYLEYVYNVLHARKTS